MSTYGPTNKGSSIYVSLPVKGSTSISDGDMLVNNSGYVEPASSGDLPVAVAVQSMDNSSGSDGDLSVKCECSPNKVFLYPADTVGNLSADDRFTKVDIAGSQSIDENAATDNIITILDFNSDDNKIYCLIDFDSGMSTST